MKSSYYDDYLEQARTELFSIRSNSTTGFRDKAGYIVDYINGLPTTRGESTLHTAIAAIAISSGSFNHLDQWEINNVNRLLKELLTTLIYNSWGNKDNSGNEHPIRHPDVIEYDASGKKIRCSPLTKDSFGAIITAGYIAYIYPNSDKEVKDLANNLIVKWADYLTQFNWFTHSNYISNEFESETINGKLYYKNIFSENEGRIMYKGPESYMLMPHEIYALKNVATLLGVETNDWDIFTNKIPSDLKQIIINDIAPLLANVASNTLFSALNTNDISIYAEQKNNKKSLIKISDEMRDSLTKSFHTYILHEIHQFIISDKYINSTKFEIFMNAVDSILPLTDLNRELISSYLKKECFFCEDWIEIVVFLGTQQLLKIMGADVISYSVWPFISECMTKPKMYPIINKFSKEFFRYLHRSSNSNGLWAWFSGNTKVIQEQLYLFKSQPQRYWWKFAYGSTKFEKWMMEPSIEPSNGRESPRLDYLVLDGLNEMGYQEFTEK